MDLYDVTTSDSVTNSEFADTDVPDENTDIWKEVLTDVRTASKNRLPSDRLLVVLGDNNAGKTSLVRRLQGLDESTKGLALEYHYIPVKEEYREDKTNLGVWVLNGDASYTHLLKYALSPQNIDKAMVLLVCSMEQPWSILECIQRWTSLLQDHLNNLEITLERVKELENRIIRSWQEYTAPDETRSITSSVSYQSMRSSMSSSAGAANNTSNPDDVLPLPDGVLTCNLGVPLVIVVTKTDFMSTLEKKHNYKEEHFDFIQQHIRRVALKYGASLFYVSTKEEKNCDVLLRYLLHKSFGFNFSTPALVVDRDSIFVPTGWDNEKKISVLYENMTSVSPEDPFDEIIEKPFRKKAMLRESEQLQQVDAEQDFQQRMQALLSKNPQQANAQIIKDVSPMAAVGMPGSPKIGKSTTGRRTSQGSAGAKKGADGSDNKMLADFFNSLLTKKTSTPPGDKAAVTRNAAAQLEKLRSQSPGSNP